jgi:hypothetical protein
MSFRILLQHDRYRPGALGIGRKREIGSGYDLVAEVYRTEGDSAADQLELAYQIAAAPSLYSAAKAALEILAAIYANDVLDDPDLEPTLAELRQAIEKAEGGDMSLNLKQKNKVQE